MESEALHVALEVGSQDRMQGMVANELDSS